ncbi:hypothetical protein DFQ01_12380 [Paenibacillus cellulosilyticus]|uniref:Uncharacterized protein n=1 Tax=Paenibacillus cellulosilyticus TaxID=375489 RepID=A0A2V2YNJ7_9BACL|nr:hypothetical protein [Paenibacillus cellulosilyticus]PWV96002.1 hypothetical protein DFQ01_12380 [Paenibacillus cellulosilyticus]QKS48466.1 hypothetical protein HUB94_29945 [Paenibacillus cellulosilyticus]
MKYRVSVNGKRRTREQVSRDRHVERLQAQAIMVDEVASQPEEHTQRQAHIGQQKQVQPHHIRIQARSRKRTRTRVAFRMLPPRQTALIYTPIRKEIRLPEQLLNKMSLPTIEAVLPIMEASRQAMVQARSSDRVLKRLQPKTFLSRSYSRFRMVEPTTARLQVNSAHQAVYRILSDRMRRFNSPIRVPPVDTDRYSAGH